MPTVATQLNPISGYVRTFTLCKIPYLCCKYVQISKFYFIVESCGISIKIHPRGGVLGPLRFVKSTKHRHTCNYNDTYCTSVSKQPWQRIIRAYQALQCRSSTWRVLGGGRGRVRARVERPSRSASCTRSSRTPSFVKRSIDETVGSNRLFRDETKIFKNHTRIRYRYGSGDCRGKTWAKVDLRDEKLRTNLVRRCVLAEFWSSAHHSCVIIIIIRSFRIVIKRARKLRMLRNMEQIIRNKNQIKLLINILICSCFEKKKYNIRSLITLYKKNPYVTRCTLILQTWTVMQAEI